MEEEDVPGAVRERMRGGVPFIARLEREHAGARGRSGSTSPSTPKRLHFFDPETGAAHLGRAVIV